MKTGSAYGKNVFGGRRPWADALSGARASGRHTHRKRPIFRQGPERANHRGRETVGEIRVASDAMLLSLQDLGKGSVAHLRETLGLPSTDGVRPVGLGLKSKAPNGKEA
jgi:hypothetical protein